MRVSDTDVDARLATVPDRSSKFKAKPVALGLVVQRLASRGSRTSLRGNYCEPSSVIGLSWEFAQLRFVASTTQAIAGVAYRLLEAIFALRTHSRRPRA
jgi:hypothetical protein